MTKWILLAILGSLVAWEAAAEITRQQRWASEDPSWWRRKVAYRVELEEIK